MKLKSHHASSASRSASPVIYSQQQAPLDPDSSNPTSSNTTWTDSAASQSNALMSSSLNAGAQFMTPTSSNSSQIWTRSAVRAARLQKQNDISPCHKHQKHHGQTQHALGTNNFTQIF